MKKEKLLIEYVLSSADLFALVASILKPEYFSPDYRYSIEFLLTYYERYNALPTVDQMEGETNVGYQQHELTKDQFEYALNEIEFFCRKEALKRAILKSAEILNSNPENEGEIRTLIDNALLVSINKDLGLSYFEDVKTRLERMAAEHSTIPTGWTQLDKIMYGGIKRKEMLLLSAVSGGGKSITMANLGVNLATIGLSVLYITLELSEDVVAQRFDTMFTGIGRDQWKYHIDEIAINVTNKKKDFGDIYIKHFPTQTTSNQIRSYLKEFELKQKFVPDVLIIDYLDLVGPNNKKIPLGDMFLKDKYTSEETRDIAVDYDMCYITASQLNRTAVGVSDLNHSHIAGGKSKIDTSDLYIQIIMNSSMRAAGEMVLLLGKTRNSDGEGQAIPMRWNSKFLRVENLDEEQTSLFNTKLKKAVDLNPQHKDNISKFDNDDVIENVAQKAETIEDLLSIFNTGD